MADGFGQRTGGLAGLRSAWSGQISRVSWGAIFAGAVSALALQAMFTLLTFGLGLSLVTGGDASGAGWGSGLFFALTVIVSLFAGGWIAGRLSGMPLTLSAILHGVVVWSLATIAAIWLGVSVTGAILSGAQQVLSTAGSAVASVAGTATQGASAAVSAVLPDLEELSVEDLQAVIPQSIQQDVEALLGEEDVSPQDLEQEVQEVANALIDDSELRQARGVLVSAGRQMLRNPGEADQIFQNAIDRLTQEGGPLGDQQFAELQGLLESRYGISPEQASEIGERWQAEFTEARDSLVETYRQTYNSVAQELNQAADAAAEAAEQAASAAASAAWWSALGLFLGLVAAGAGAWVGRPDEATAAEIARGRP